MHVLELIAARPLVWTVFLVYVATLALLALLGRRRARRDAGSFAVAKRLHPIVAGMTIAASLASTATFVINPGFVYVHGLSAFIHLGVAATLGMATGLLVVCPRFRARGAAGGARTVPQWIGDRYGSAGLRTYFAALNLLTLAFLVLIIGGLAIVMQTTLGLGYRASLLAVTAIVVGYVLAGGAYANAYANSLQAVIKASVAVLIVASGLHHLLTGPTEVAASLRAVDPNLIAPVNPASSLFGSWFSVYASGFIVGFALMCQPHIMTTALSVENDRGIRKALVVAIGLCFLYAGVLLAGLYAHLDGIPRAAMLDPATGAFRQDRVMAVYLAHTFSPAGIAVVTVAILAAGMSAMSSILLALSGITGNDLYGRWRQRRGLPSDAIASTWVARGAVVVFAGLAVAIALDPPKLLGIFGQLGAYGVVTAAAAPLVLGVAIERLGRRAATAGALLGPVVHFTLYAAGRWGGVDARGLGIDLANPGVTAAIAILASTTLALTIHAVATSLSASGVRPAVPAPHPASPS